MGLEVDGLLDVVGVGWVCKANHDLFLKVAGTEGPANSPASVEVLLVEVLVGIVLDSARFLDLEGEITDGGWDIGVNVPIDVWDGIQLNRVRSDGNIDTLELRGHSWVRWDLSGFSTEIGKDRWELLLNWLLLNWLLNNW